MRRRAFVSGLSTVGAVGTVGCLGDDDTGARTDEEHLDELRAEIDDRGVPVREIDLDEVVVAIEHGYDEPNDAVANVAMAFVERIADDLDVERLDGYMRADGGTDWTWHAEAEWARAYADGEVDPDEYGRRISETLAMELETGD